MLTIKPTYILALVIIACLLPIVVAWEAVLLYSLPGGMALGTLMAAIALVAVPWFIILTSQTNTALNYVAKVLGVAACIWLPLGFILSGSASLNFVNDVSSATFFWRYTAALGVLLLLTMIWAFIHALIARRAAKRARG